MRNSYLIAGIIVVILVAAAFVVVRNRIPIIGQVRTSPTPTGVAQVQKDTIIVSPHTPAQTVVVDSVTLTKPGFVAIFENKDGQVGTLLGVSGPLQAGKVDNLVIDLNRRTTSGEQLLAAVHTDNGNGTFEFPGPDEMVKDTNNNTVTATLQVSAETSGFQIPATGLGQ